MAKKNRKTKTAKKYLLSLSMRKLLLLVSLLVISLTALYIFFSYQNANDGNDDTYTVSGKVTEKLTSCGHSILADDGSVKKLPGVCDGGNALFVGNLRISTGGGALVAHRPKHISNINSIEPGDWVEVRYVLRQNGHASTASTDCDSCYVRK